MANLIEFLELLGQDSDLRHAAPGDLEPAIARAQLNAEMRGALLTGDQRRLEAILGASTNVCCMIHAPKNDEPEEEKTRKAKEDDREKAA